jgi:inorganic triphosphatase YgiF
MAHQVALKLAVAPDRHAVLQRHALLANAVSREQHTLVSIYYDTGRLSLRRAGLLLRLRRNGESWMQTVKRQSESGLGLTARPEWQAPYRSHFDFSHIDDAPMRDWFAREKIASRIASVFETRVKRTCWQLEPRPGARVLVKLDRGWIAADGRREIVSEIELQLLSGDIDDIYALALDLAEKQSLVPLLVSKAERGYRLARNTPERPVRAAEVDILETQSPLAAFRLIALDCLAHLQANHAGAVSSDDAEYVHQMRVATRRLRAALRLFRPILPPQVEETLVPPLRTLMRQLGQARDLDVLMSEIVAPVALAIPDDPRLTDLASAITLRQYAARNAIRQALRQPAHGRLMLQAGRLLHGQSLALAAADGDDDLLLAFADRRLRRLLRRIIELAEAVKVDYPPSLHELRIAIKRLRYALEFFGTMLPGKAGKAVLKRLAGLQEELGQLNDLASAGNLLMVCAGRQPLLREAVTLVAGWHGQRHAGLLADIPLQVEKVRDIKLPRLR